MKVFLATTTTTRSLEKVNFITHKKARIEKKTEKIFGARNEDVKPETHYLLIGLKLLKLQETKFSRIYFGRVKLLVTD